MSCFTSKAFLFSHNILSLTDKNSSDFDSVVKTHYLWADIGEKTHRCCQQRRILFLHAPLPTCRCLLGVQFVTRHSCNQTEHDKSNTINRQAQEPHWNTMSFYWNTSSVGHKPLTFRPSTTVCVCLLYSVRLSM